MINVPKFYKNDKKIYESDLRNFILEKITKLSIKFTFEIVKFRLYFYNLFVEIFKVYYTFKKWERSYIFKQIRESTISSVKFLNLIF